MLEYQIERWDSVLVDGHRLPMIYFRPDSGIMEMFKNSNYVTACIIRRTGLQYDNQTMLGSVNSSANVPNNRPNFFESSGLYVVVLQSSWNGYPRYNQLGSVSFINPKDV